MDKTAVIKEFLRERARNGGKARAANHSKEELSKMAKAAWKRRKRRLALA
jgi:hypothetical protein